MHFRHLSAAYQPNPLASMCPWCIPSEIVPADEGNHEAFLFNLIHAIRGDNERWDYLCHQYIECVELGIMEIEDDSTLEDTLAFLAKDHPDAANRFKRGKT